MKDNHLSESEIQEFVLNTFDSQTTTLHHLEACSHCQAKAKQYRLLFTVIKEQVKPEFDFDLSELVLSAVVASRSTIKWTNAFVYSLALLGLIFIALALILFKENATLVFDGLAKMTLYLLLVPTLAIAGFLGVEIYKGYARKIQALKILLNILQQ